jgi:ABC-type Na+ efflux pump permease subunit
MKLNIHQNLKKGQALPLNTIVIAILVIVVLLVIIIFFTSSVGESGQAIQDQSVTQCSSSNPALATLGYTGFISKEIYGGDGGNGGYTKAIGVSDCYVSKDVVYDKWEASN